MNDDNDMDLLDLDVDDGSSMDSLPEVAPFTTPHPRKPWLLFGVGLLIIIIATYVVVRVVNGDNSSSVDVDLDAPHVVESVETMDVNPNPLPVDVVKSDVTPPPPPAIPVDSVPPVLEPTPNVAPVPEPVAQRPMPVPRPEPEHVQESVGMPVRVIEDRKETRFNPDKPAPKVATRTNSKKALAHASAKKVEPKPQVAAKGGWYVQFGSYSSRALAESAQRQIIGAHANLFKGKQFVILAAVMPNGNTVYRLRIAFASSADANGFCRNAKSDGLDCYVAK